MTMGFNISDIAWILLFILISMGFHEAMHAFVAHWLGDTTAKDEGRLSLNPLMHVDLITTVLLPLALIILRIPPFFIAKPVPFNPDRVRYGEFGAALIGLAGPLTNLFLAVLGSVIIRSFDIGGFSFIGQLLIVFIQVNIGFFVFNMIPFPPLDGSRVLYAFAPQPIQKLMFQIEQMGLIAIFAFMFLLFPLVSRAVGFVSEWLFLLLLS
jgi:Zn-dependent protease